MTVQIYFRQKFIIEDINNFQYIRTTYIKSNGKKGFSFHYFKYESG